MDAVIIEKPDESNVETNVDQDEQHLNVPEEAVKEETGEKQPEETSQSTKEATVEIDGEQVPVSQVAEWRKIADDRKKWDQTNTQRAQELSAKEKRLERYSFLEEAVQKNPEVLKTLFQPPVVRNFDSELQGIYQKKPQDIFSPEYAQWEMEKDQAVSERARRLGAEDAKSEILRSEAQSHNERLGAETEKRLKDKGRTEDEIYRLGTWVAENIKPKNGKYDASAFEVAENHLFGSETLRQTKIDTARQTANAISRAKPAGDVLGVNKTTDQKTEDEKRDDAFITRVKEQYASR